MTNMHDIPPVGAYVGVWFTEHSALATTTMVGLKYAMYVPA